MKLTCFTLKRQTVF